MSYGTSLPYTYRRAAIYVGRVIKGEKRADLPVMQPTKYDFVLNIKTAKAPGLNIGTATRTRRRGDRIRLPCCDCSQPLLALRGHKHLRRNVRFG